MEILLKEAVEGIDTEEVKNEDLTELRKQAEEMINLCAKSGGIGLAAPQVGIYKKFFVMETLENTYEVMINPIFFPVDKKISGIIEGCLSYPDENYLLQRFKNIRAVYYGIGGGKLKKITKNFSGEKAYVFQHELDHLTGITIATKGAILK